MGESSRAETVEHDYGDIPGPDGLPVLGSLRSYADDPLGFWTETAREYGPITKFRLGTREFVLLTAPEYVDRVLIRKNDVYIRGGQFQKRLQPILGDGIVTSEGEQWRKPRRTLDPAFHPDEVERYSRVVTDVAERYSETWADGEVMDVHEEMLALTVEVIVEALFDTDISDETETTAQALETILSYTTRQIQRPVQIPQWMPTPGNRTYKRAIADIHAIADRIIDKNTGKARDGNDVIPLLLNADYEPTREEIRNQVVTLLLAGHETAALTMTYTLQLLSKHPEQLATLNAEFDEVLAGRTPTMDDLSELTYTERVVKESMRVYPAIHGILRATAEDDVVDGYLIPEGTTIIVSQWVLHRDPEYFDDPTAFRPERWTDGLEADLPRLTYFPFAGGRHRCIGDHFAMMEARLLLATLLQEWEFETTVDELSFSPSITNRPAHPVEMKLKRR